MKREKSNQMKPSQGFFSSFFFSPAEAEMCRRSVADRTEQDQQEATNN